jgi:hypothetical protein
MVTSAAFRHIAWPPVPDILACSGAFAVNRKLGNGPTETSVRPWAFNLIGEFLFRRKMRVCADSTDCPVSPSYRSADYSDR